MSITSVYNSTLNVPIVVSMVAVLGIVEKNLDDDMKLIDLIVCLI